MMQLTFFTSPFGAPCSIFRGSQLSVCRWTFWLLMCVALLPALDAQDTGPSAASEHVWLPDLSSAYQDALARKRPILVRAGTESSPWCKQLEAELAKPAARDVLRSWTLVYVDVDRTPHELQHLGIGPIPALRVLTSQGRLLASHDGFLPTDDLVKWLNESYASATAAPDDILLGADQPTLVEVLRLVRQFNNRDAAVREAAIGRLLPFPQVAGSAVIKALQDGSLSSQLAALEILRQWKAPVEELDPWQPSTCSEERLGALQQWLTELKPDATYESPQTLTDDQWQSVRRDIQHMLQAEADEVVAVRERLARFGIAVLPEVVTLLKDAVTDRDRERLLTLRYRLVAGGTLVLTWPGGLERLAHTDPTVRHQAAEELATMATEDLQPLLLELFSDPDPLVRELSLRGLRSVGGRQATDALVELLKDPEPNVRAAVLKQLTEDAPKEMVDEITQYVQQETDSDLVVHAVRYFRAVGGKSTASLLPLLEHSSWQVRAEAAEAISENASSNGFDEGPGEPDVFAALLKLLGDPDAFVLSRALAGLQNVNTRQAVEPLVRAAREHPALATQIVTILAQGIEMREAAIPHLREFSAQEDPLLRAAAISGLCQADPESVNSELAAALADSHTKVRTAAATSLLALLERAYPGEERNYGAPPVDVPTVINSPFQSGSSTTGGGGGGLLQRALKSLFPGAPPNTTEEAPDNEGASATDTDGAAADQTADKPLEPEPATEESPPAEVAASDDATGEWARPNPFDDLPPVEVAESASPTLIDQWLAELYAGQHREAWTSALGDPLQKMLVAESSEERLAAALALIPLGHFETARPVLLAAAREKADLLLKAGQAFKWVPGTAREELFWELASIVRDHNELVMLASTLQQVNDVRLATVYLKLMEREDVSRELTQLVELALQQVYFGNWVYQTERLPARRRKRAVADLEPHASSGPAVKRLLAIVLLRSIAADKAVEYARNMMDDESVPAESRQDAFHLVLATQTRSDRIKQAISTLADPDLHRRLLALKYLAVGRSALETLPGTGLFLRFDDEENGFSREAKVIVPEPPRGLTAEHVRPLVSSEDAESAAYAGYLLALFDDASGMDPLLKFWRAQKSGATLDRRVYRAVAVLDDSQYLPVLREIYGRLKDESDLQEFYWTIRIMSGPEILEFRKRIRREVGMSNLQ